MEVEEGGEETLTFHLYSCKAYQGEESVDWRAHRSLQSTVLLGEISHLRGKRMIRHCSTLAFTLRQHWGKLIKKNCHSLTQCELSQYALFLSSMLTKWNQTELLIIVLSQTKKGQNSV